MGAISVWITSTNMASDGSSRTSSGVPWKHGSAGSSPEREEVDMLHFEKDLDLNPAPTNQA